MKFTHQASKGNMLIFNDWRHVLGLGEPPVPVRFVINAEDRTIKDAHLMVDEENWIPVEREGVVSLAKVIDYYHVLDRLEEYSFLRSDSHPEWSDRKMGISIDSVEKENRSPVPRG